MIDYKPLIDWINYRSYEHNRRENPEIEYWRWRQIYKDAITFEEIYQQNLNRILGVKNASYPAR